MVRGLTRFVLSTVGSTGDVVPYLALAQGLLARGHAVRVASHAFHRAFFEAHGVDFAAVGAPFDVAEFNRVVAEAAKKSAPIQQFDVLVRRLFLREPARQLADLEAAMDGAELAVCQRFDYVGQEAAIRRAIPWASVTLAPQLIPTAEAPVYPTPDLGSATWNKVTWLGLENLAAPTNRHVAEVLRSIGAAPRKLDVAGASSPRLDLVAASPSLVIRRGDWPRATRLTGAWFTQPAPPPTDPALLSALDRRPLVFTFGSMGGGSAAETTRLVLDTAARLGRPAIVQAGYAGLASAGSADVLFVGHVPHEHLFARAACVVHHAGAGTTHAALRAGAPQAPLPHLFDQYYWAGRLHDQGVAPKLLFRHHANPRKLAAHVDEAIGRAPQAQVMARRITAERGVDEAIEALTALVG